MKRKIIGSVLALALAFGTAAVLPGVTDGISDIAVTASAAASKAPKNLKATVGDGEVTLTWDPVNGAKKYRIYYCKAGKNSYEYLEETESTTYTVTGLTTGYGYNFRVATDLGYVTTVKNVRVRKPVYVDINAKSTAKDFLVLKDKDGKKYVAAYKGTAANVIIPKGVDYIGETAFWGNQTIMTLTIPEGAAQQGIAAGAFLGCYNLEKVTINGDCDEIGSSAFDDCFSLKEVTINGDVKSGICPGAFKHCYNLETVVFGKKNANVKYIGTDAFAGCYSLSSINIPDSVKEIGSDAFTNCASLSNLTIPAKAKVGKRAFGYMQGFERKCKSLSMMVMTKPKKLSYIKADGKKSIYWEYECKNTGSDPDFKAGKIDTESGYLNCEGLGKARLSIYGITLTQKAITLTVTKGSPAETWAKENDIKYVYAKSGGSAA